VYNKTGDPADPAEQKPDKSIENEYQTNPNIVDTELQMLFSNKS